jgi:hypothetical protein
MKPHADKVENEKYFEWRLRRWRNIYMDTQPQ